MQEGLVGTREVDLRVVIRLYPLHDGTYGLALAIKVAGDLLRFGQQELVALVVEKQHLFLPYLIDVGHDDGTDQLAVFGREVVLLELQDLRGQRLSEVEDGASAEVGEVHLVGHFFTDGTVGVDLLRIA